METCSILLKVDRRPWIKNMPPGTGWPGPALGLGCVEVTLEEDGLTCEVPSDCELRSLATTAEDAERALTELASELGAPAVSGTANTRTCY